MLFLILAMMLPTAVNAQMRDSVFKDYKAYNDFVDQKVTIRDFKPFILALGGRDEYSPDQLEKINKQLLNVFRKDFANKTVFRRVELGGGFSQEARAYWNGESYAYYYAILHQRKNDLVVINFSLNSDIGVIMAKF
jgi:hypothetical protein